MRQVLFCLLLSVPFTLSAQLGLSLVGSKDYTPKLNDIWGYVDGSGTEYALVGLTNGVSIVSLADPASPHEIHFIPGAVSVWRDLKTYGNFAYVSNENGNGTLIIDLSGLPDEIVYKDTVMNGITRAHNVYVDQDQLYQIGTNNYNGGIVRFSLADPWNPTFVAAYTDRYVHDAYVRDDTAYAGEISNGFLTIIDWSQPNIPTVLSTTSYLNSFTHNTWLSDDGNTCFTTDEIAGGFIYSWDVSNPFNPVQLDEIRSSLSEGRAIPHNVHVKNNFLITSYYRDGLHITDASRPHNLVEVGYYDTSPMENDGFNGAWGAYPFLPSGLILVSDIENGLFIFQPSYTRGCYLEGKIRDAVTQAVLANVHVEFLRTKDTTNSLTNGDYAIGTALSGTYEVAFFQYGYLPDTMMVTLNHGVVEDLDVNLVPVGRVPLSVVVKDAQTLQPVAGATVRLTANTEQESFEYKTISNGFSGDNYFVINDYILRVGKWGYRYAEQTELIDSTNYQIEVFLEPGYEDGFGLDLGWTVISTAERGIWQRAEPRGTYRENGDIYQPEYDLPFDIGDKAYVTGNYGTEPFGDDVDNGYTMLISPPMDLSNYNEPVIEYFWWFLNWSLKWGGTPGNDFLEVSITDGIDAFAIKTYIGPLDTLWRHESSFYFMKYFQNLNRDFQIIFYTQDFETGNQDAVEAAIDGFRVMESAPTSLEPSSVMQADLVARMLAGNILHAEWKQCPPGTILHLTDLSGRLIMTTPLRSPDGSCRHHLDLSPGIYILRLSYQEQTFLTRKIIAWE